LSDLWKEVFETLCFNYVPVVHAHAITSVTSDQGRFRSRHFQLRMRTRSLPVAPPQQIWLELCPYTTNWLKVALNNDWFILGRFISSGRWCLHIENENNFNNMYHLLSHVIYCLFTCLGFNCFNNVVIPN
jgi:hypothetical protein